MVLALALLVPPTGVPPLEAPQAAAPRVVFTFDLPAPAGPPRDQWRSPKSLRTQSSPARRHSKVDRIIGTVAGGALGFVAGGMIGGRLAENRDNPDDDISALRGVMIGAPIGAVVGALLGYRLTK
jgi:uncharacterized protein YcfJ